MIDFATRMIYKEILTSIRCHNCQAVPRHPELVEDSDEIGQFFVCVTNCHRICCICRDQLNFKCVCGSSLTESPDRLLTSIMRSLPYICQHQSSGCSEVFVGVEDLLGEFQFF